MPWVRAWGSLSIPGWMFRRSAWSSGTPPSIRSGPFGVSGDDTPARAPLAARSSAEVLKKDTVFIFFSETWREGKGRRDGDGNGRVRGGKGTDARRRCGGHFSRSECYG